ncbi:DUF349 domain-containing protein [Mangrovitalea sediminis]|uniref:DUF349 domain-containing protein n=1 Tax=Mangrovitalea sediminis TaxID=1982043 RepID=UPI000BE4C725|nr:DUF349 domain-containing protein [Mangrovitalea sediminis]
MPAFLKGLFKNNKSAEKPQPALSRVQKADPTDPNVRQELIELVQQSDDTALRQVALERLNRMEWLIPLYPEVSRRERDQIAVQVAELARQPGKLEQARAALTDPAHRQLLEQLAAAPDEDTLPEALLNDAAQLERLAVEGRTSKQRLAAIEHVEDEDALQRIAKAAKGRDKTIYQTARRRLQQIREAAAADEARQRGTELVIAAMEAHAATDSTQLYEARFEALQQQWNNLPADIEIALQQRYLDALHRCRERIAKLHEEAASEAASQEKQEQRKATLEVLESTLSSLQHDIPAQGPSLAGLDAVLKTQENRWLEATRETSVERNEQKHYQELMHDLRVYVQALSHLERSRLELREVLDQPEGAETDEAALASRRKTLQRLLQEINWPEGYAEPELVTEVRQRLGATQARQHRVAEDQKKRQKSLRQAMDDLDKALEQRVLKQSRHIYKEVQHLFAELDNHHADPFKARLHLLGKQLQELRDWEGFATRPKQIELCEHMEYLAGQHMVPEAKAERIKELQKEWRELGGSSDQKLWQRFKDASDRAYAPCHDFFVARSELKHANVHKRQMICDQLVEFLENIDWHGCDWKAVDQIHRRAREEWRSAWPVDFRENRPVQKQFDRLLRDIEHHLSEEYARNHALKQDIVDRARSLVDAEPLHSATDGAKALQQEWKKIGMTRPRDDRQLWQAFREACDAVFARRDKQRAEQAQHNSDQLAKADEILKDMAQLQQQESIDSIKVDELRRNFQGLTLPREHKQGILKRFGELSDQLKSRINDLDRKEHLQHWLQFLQQHAGGETIREPAEWSAFPWDTAPQDPQELAIRAEIVAGQPSPEEDQALRMQLQVNRLAQGLNHGQTWRSPMEEMGFLVACWCRIPADSSDNRQHWRGRLEAALRSLA